MPRTRPAISAFKSTASFGVTVPTEESRSSTDAVVTFTVSTGTAMLGGGPPPPFPQAASRQATSTSVLPWQNRSPRRRQRQARGGDFSDNKLFIILEIPASRLPKP